MPTNIQRVKRFFGIWRRSGRLGLAINAVRWRCQAVVMDFLLAGGRVSGDEVLYKNVNLPRSLFAGPDLGGLVYVTQLVDYGATIGQGEVDVYPATLPSGLTFQASINGFVDTMCMLVERFVSEEYSWLDADGSVVIDIGANVGDSAIYFASRGAVVVYGYEPDTTALQVARRNLAQNRIGNVNLTQAAVTGKCAAGLDDCISFGEVLDRARNENDGIPIVCKIDCEGCEFEIFSPGTMHPDAMKFVSQIMIEYHWKSPDPIARVLRQLGFEAATTPGSRGVGWIRARKQVNANPVLQADGPD